MRLTNLFSVTGKHQSNTDLSLDPTAGEQIIKILLEKKHDLIIR